MGKKIKPKNRQHNQQDAEEGGHASAFACPYFHAGARMSLASAKKHACVLVRAYEVGLAMVMSLFYFVVSS